MADNKLLSEISQGKELKHAETNDKSAPAIPGSSSLWLARRNFFYLHMTQLHTLIPTTKPYEES
jgi:hypothetical protein